MGLWLWGPDYPDPQDYLVFGPGALVGLRAGWAEGAAPEIEAVAQEAATTVDDAAREPLYRAVPAACSTSPGPFFPLFQPAAAVVSVTDRVTGASFHPTLQLDVAARSRTRAERRRRAVASRRDRPALMARFVGRRWSRRCCCCSASRW